MKKKVNIKEYLSYQRDELDKECGVNSFTNILNRLEQSNNITNEDTSLVKNSFNIKKILSYCKNYSLIYFGAGAISTAVFLFTFNITNNNQNRVEVLAIKTEDINKAIETVDSIDSFN
ncbi:MAG: hypothetical protein QM532_01895 [Cyanobium sp. MAG06]|nr:hypothetical protein [Cyanobium sp. MAG06]